MKQTVNFSHFVDAFRDAGRESQFSYDALCVLFDHFEQYEEDTGEELELDVIAICCDYAEGTWQEIANAYGVDLTGQITDKECKELVCEYLLEQGAYVAHLDDGFVYRQH